MAIALIQLTWCDRHLQEKNEEVPAEPMPDWGGFNLDLCADCRAPIDEAMALYTEYGSKGKRTKAPKAVARVIPSDPQPGDHRCPQPGCEGLSFATRESLGAHGRQLHNMSIGELLGLPLPFTCDECGRKFSSPQGVAGRRF